MAFTIDPQMHWTDHFIKYGFAVLRNQVSREFIDKALAQVRTHVEGDGKDLPFEQWTVQNIKTTAKPVNDPVLDTIFDQPNIRHIINTMFGTSEVGVPNGWSGNRIYQIFVSAYDPGYVPQPFHGGHIDFGGHIVPLLGDAFVIQVALHDTAPFGGNITVIPGSHKLVQKRALDNPYTQYPYDFEDFPFEEPYEFVAQAGDVFLMHHLMFHSGHRCSVMGKPRIALHMQAQRTEWLTVADPDDPSPWVRSSALNGRIEDANDQQRYLSFSDSKKAMWGYWTSEDGKTQYKVYTWVDGALRAKIQMANGAEQISQKARFDGQRLTFQQFLDSPRTRGQAVLELDSQDPERMTCRIQAEDATEPVLIHLRRTEIITSRLAD